jgi:hypothetical protein
LNYFGQDFGTTVVSCFWCRWKPFCKPGRYVVFFDGWFPIDAVVDDFGNLVRSQ